LTGFFQNWVFQAIEQEIVARDRQALAVALGRLGDPRIVANLRVAARPDEHPGYVQIPSGRYYVGEKKKAVDLDEAFWLSKYPVTNSQYALFLAEGGYTAEEHWLEDGWRWLQDGHVTSPKHWRNPDFNAPNQPVVGVSYWEADAFCRWVGGFLPTGFQWEAAARGPRRLEYPWGDQWEGGIYNSLEAELGRTSVVGIFPRDRSDLTGVMDMAGNVLEWCQQDIDKAARTVFRGGCGRDSAGGCRAVSRFGIDPQYRDYDMGFRVAAVPTGGPKNKRAEG